MIRNSASFAANSTTTSVSLTPSQRATGMVQAQLHLQEVLPNVITMSVTSGQHQHQHYNQQPMLQV